MKYTLKIKSKVSIPPFFRIKIYTNNQAPLVYFTGTNSSRSLEFDVLKLFTHVITHEFHHKGQVMSMCRLLGYTSVDADVIRF